MTLSPLAVAIVLAFGGGSASGQSAVTPAQPVSAAQSAAARAEADRLIAAGDAGAWFDNVSEGAEPRARHRPSGLICRFTPGDPNNSITIFPSPMPRGDDVGCNVGAGDRARTVYATRYGGLNLSPEQAMGIAEASIRQRFPDARPYEGALATASREGATPTLAVAYRIGDGYTQALLAHVGDWSIKERLTQPASPSTEEQLVNGLMWSILLGDVVEAQGD